MMSEKSAEQRPTLEQTISLGHRRLHPLLRDSYYLSLIERRKRFAEAVKQVPGNSLRVLDVGGRIQPYRPLLDGRLEAYIAVDLQRTELVDVLAVGERLPFAEGVFDVVLCSQMLCYAEDAPKVIDEIYSVLRPGGALLLSVPAILPYHAENDRWRFSPGALRLLLSRFSRVDVSPEGYSLLGACHVVAHFVDSFGENTLLQRLVHFTLIPLVNLVGKRFDNWSRPDTSLSNSFFAFARK